ncbi:MAG: Phosphoenolpyruvate synthase [Candidatus Gottesmanbacteria bacterium GW2011_GWA1_48_13]|uniref:Phosphoenolpyruvate synthase n=1 Tax=Candidatus Gottesmanbacteria bacterium GW2011_GWA1_48_13 TaxID=1618439 RepID=A0A0G1UPG3_9BACT|nr:MAG: Phosphoenolpyruvate synthase [Candidatus Gottesmanbacteria bacterium GW2011_GWA1_48_13]
MNYVKWFKDLSKEDIGIAGGKGANLGELTQAGIPVPPGFVVLSSAYFDFLEQNKLRPKIHQILSVTNIDDPAQLNSASKKIQKIMADCLVPSEIARQIFHSYHKLGSRQAVAVRSSATAEDLPEASFAGQQESYLNVLGDANVVAKVKACWLSLFGARSIFYRHQQKFDHFKVGIAVPIQAMIQSEVSGVIFTVDPITHDKDTLVIEAIWGLGDYIVQGVVTPDHFEVSKASGEIINRQIATQEIMEVRSAQGVKQVKVPAKLQKVQKLSDVHVLQLAEIGRTIHDHYYFPQDIEWALQNKKIYITQSRPITTLKQKTTNNYEPITNHEVLLKGAPASPGLVSGPVKIANSVKFLDKVKTGDILVSDMTTPDFVPAMKRAAGIITDRGGLTSHAAIVSRELGVPCVVGTTTATKVLKDGQIVTINGASGDVYDGALQLQSIKLQDQTSNLQLPHSNSKTATKIYVNLAEPELAKKTASRNVDGVGLLRAEFMIAGIGTHPKKIIADGKQKDFITKLAEKLTEFCQAFAPRPVVYRATDFKTNEYRSLKGGDLYEPQESNPMLGFRGAFRYVADPAVFDLELEAIKVVRNKHKLTNLHLMIPFVRTPQEMLLVKKQVAAAGLTRGSSFKLWMMVEIPSNVILLDDFIDTGIDGVSIGSNDLTMMLMGTDRDNAEVASVFDERNPAVLWALEKIIKTCLKRDITCSICGQAPSQYPDLVEKLVSWGITSVSVNPDAIERTRELVYNSEERIVKHGRHS